MRRDEAIQVLAACRNDAISVSAMQAIMAWHAIGQGTRDNVDALGCMGSASSIGLGIALARPERKVMVLDGDGCLLMQLGSLVSVAAQGVANYYHFVFENGRYETSGNQALPGYGSFDFPKIAVAAGYRNAISIEDKTELEQILPTTMSEPGPTLVRLAIAPDEPVTPWPNVTMTTQINDLRSTLQTDR